MIYSLICNQALQKYTWLRYMLVKKYSGCYFWHGAGGRIILINYTWPRFQVWDLTVFQLNNCSKVFLFLFCEFFATLFLEGHWAILQNIHLVKSWLPSLEKKIEEYSEGSHVNYRIFLSAEPAPNPEQHIIPQRFQYLFLVDLINRLKNSLFLRGFNANF